MVRVAQTLRHQVEPISSHLVDKKWLLVSYLGLTFWIVDYLDLIIAFSLLASVSRILYLHVND